MPIILNPLDKKAYLKFSKASQTNNLFRPTNWKRKPKPRIKRSLMNNEGRNAELSTSLKFHLAPINFYPRSHLLPSVNPFFYVNIE